MQFNIGGVILGKIVDPERIKENKKKQRRERYNLPNDDPKKLYKFYDISFDNPPYNKISLNDKSIEYINEYINVDINDEIYHDTSSDIYILKNKMTKHESKTKFFYSNEHNINFKHGWDLYNIHINNKDADLLNNFDIKKFNEAFEKQVMNCHDMDRDNIMSVKNIKIKNRTYEELLIERENELKDNTFDSNTTFLDNSKTIRTGEEEVNNILNIEKNNTILIDNTIICPLYYIPFFEHNYGDDFMKLYNYKKNPHVVIRTRGLIGVINMNNEIIIPDGKNIKMDKLYEDHNINYIYENNDYIKGVSELDNELFGENEKEIKKELCDKIAYIESIYDKLNKYNQSENIQFSYTHYYTHIYNVLRNDYINDTLYSVDYCNWYKSFKEDILKHNIRPSNEFINFINLKYDILKKIDKKTD